MKQIIFALLLFSSCTPVYVPNIRNSPMFGKAGEFQLTGQVGNGIDGQVAVSVSNHIGMIANYNYIDRNSSEADGDPEFLRHKFFEGGLGYFTNQTDMFFEIFAGYGRGQGQSSRDFIGLGSATGKYERYFVQPGLGMNHKTVHVSFVPRVSMVDFTEYSNGTTSFPINEDPKFFFEPAVVTKVNSSNNIFFFTFQGGFSVPLSDDKYFDHRRYQLSTGLGLRIGGRKSEATKSR